MTDQRDQRIARLKATRERLEAQLADPKTPAYSVAPLSNQLRLTDKEIDRLEAKAEADDDGLPTTPEKATWLDFIRFSHRGLVLSRSRPLNEWGRREKEILDEWERAGFRVKIENKPKYQPYGVSLTADERAAAEANRKREIDEWVEECRAELRRCLEAYRAQQNQPDDT